MVDVKYDPDMIARHLWIVLIAVVIIAAILIIFEPGKPVESVCTGFQYFVFLSQKMTGDKYTVELLNGPRDISVRGMLVNGVDVGAEAVSVPAGENFLVNSLRDPTDKKAEETFGYKITVLYDMASISDNRDTATCTGKVQ